MRLVLAEEYLEDEDILEMVQAGLVDITVVDEHKAHFWAQFCEGLTVHPELSRSAGREAGLGVPRAAFPTSSAGDWSREFVGPLRALEELEIAQTDEAFRIFDEADNLRIYYLDGGKRARQTPWGAKLDTVANWDGPQITVRTSGKEVGDVRRRSAWRDGSSSTWSGFATRTSRTRS